MSSDPLALFGGPRAVSVGVPPPVEAGVEAAAAGAAAVNVLGRRAPSLSSLSGAGLIHDLEVAFESYLGVRHALGVSSGTAALHAALAACGVRWGQEVIVSAYDWGAAAAAARAVGATPVYADIDPLTYTIAPASAVERISDRTAAIVATHIFGHPADMDALAGLARGRGLALIEDCAQSLGARYKGSLTGTLGDAACFSLGPGKDISAGEGGILVTNRADVFERAVRFCQHPLRQMREGAAPNYFSLNYRIHPLAPVLALPQVRSFDTRLKARRESSMRLQAVLAEAPGVRDVFDADACDHSFHRLSPSFVPEEWGGLSRSVVVGALAAEGVPIGDGFVHTPLPLRNVPERCRPNVSEAANCPIAAERCAYRELAMTVPCLPPPEFHMWLDQVRVAISKVYGLRRHLLGAVAATRSRGPAGWAGA